MLKKEDLWGQFSGRMSTSPRTGFLPQQNTHTHIHTTPTTHHTPHMPHTQYTHIPSPSASFSHSWKDLRDRAGPCARAWLLQKKFKLHAALFPQTLLSLLPSTPLAGPVLPLVNVWVLLPCFLLTSFKPLFCSLII